MRADIFADYWWENQKSGSFSILESSHTDHVEIIQDNCDISFHLLSNIRNYLFYVQEFAKKCSSRDKFVTADPRERSEWWNLRWRLFWIAFCHPFSHLLFGRQLFESSAQLKRKTSRISCCPCNQGHLGSTHPHCTYTALRSLFSGSVAYLAWKRRSCAGSLQCHPVFAQNTLGGSSDSLAAAFGVLAIHFCGRGELSRIIVGGKKLD